MQTQQQGKARNGQRGTGAKCVIASIIQSVLRSGIIRLIIPCPPL